MVLKLFGNNIFKLDADAIDNLLRRINRNIIVKDEILNTFKIKSLRALV